MFMKTCFRQDCPVCGRPLRIAVELLGRDAICEHCQGNFVATDPTTSANRDVISLVQPLLIVQPNRGQLDMLTRRFTELAYVVTPVYHPRQALEAATFKDFRVAVIDGSLPEIDSLELAQRLSGLVRNLTVILLVEPNHALLTDDFPSEAIWMVLEKPCPLKRLESAVENAVQEAYGVRFRSFAETEELSVSVAPR